MLQGSGVRRGASAVVLSRGISTRIASPADRDAARRRPRRVVLSDASIAQTNKLDAKIQFKGCAVRFIPSPSSIQPPLAHISEWKRNYFAVT